MRHCFRWFSHCQLNGAVSRSIPEMNRDATFHRGIFRFCALACFLVFGYVSTAQTNSWVDPNSGLWNETNGWSLGILPASGQSVLITNAGEKSVLVTAAVASTAPSSLSIGRLTLGGSNTLTLDNVGPHTFAITNGLMMNAGSTVSIVNSTMTIGGVPDLTLGTGATFYQNGGSVSGSTGSAFSGDYYLFDGNATFNEVSQYGGSIEQYGGNAFFSLRVEGGRYDLYGGIVSMFLDPFYTCNITQFGGTNYVLGGRYKTPGLHLGGSDVFDHTPRNFHVDGGCMFANSVNVAWGGNFDLSAGTVRITNEISIFGTGDGRGHPVTYNFGYFSVDGGQLFAKSLQLNNFAGSYAQGAGTVRITGDIQFVGSTDNMVAALALSGGTLSCSNLEYAGGVVDIEQSGGNLIVSNLLAFDGYYNGYQYYTYIIPPRFVRYDFSGGTLTARNIELSAEWNIGSSTNSSRISNSGYFQTSGTLTIGDANEQLGRFILASNAVISFTGNTTTLGFADSHTATWTSGVFLSVSNWNGSLNGGGADRLKFGTSASGLTAAQVAQIRFVNPNGFAAGTYAARILSTGEVVPFAPAVTTKSANNALVISWPDSSYFLQASTNVLGPWTNVAAASPYTNSFTDGPQEFFRLVR